MATAGEHSMTTMHVTTTDVPTTATTMDAPGSGEGLLWLIRAAAHVEQQTMRPMGVGEAVAATPVAASKSHRKTKPPSIGTKSRRAWLNPHPLTDVQMEKLISCVETYRNKKGQVEWKRLQTKHFKELTINALRSAYRRAMERREKKRDTIHRLMHQRQQLQEGDNLHAQRHELALPASSAPAPAPSTATATDGLRPHIDVSSRTQLKATP